MLLFDRMSMANSGAFYSVWAIFEAKLFQTQETSEYFITDQRV